MSESCSRVVDVSLCALREVPRGRLFMPSARYPPSSLSTLLSDSFRPRQDSDPGKYCMHHLNEGMRTACILANSRHD
jgi:hypothetical protein